MGKGHRIRLKRRTMIEISFTWSVSLVNVPNHFTDNPSISRQRHTQDAHSIPSILHDYQDRHWVYSIDLYLWLLRYLVHSSRNGAFN